MASGGSRRRSPEPVTVGDAPIVGSGERKRARLNELAVPAWAGLSGLRLQLRRWRSFGVLDPGSRSRGRRKCAAAAHSCGTAWIEVSPAMTSDSNFKQHRCDTVFSRRNLRPSFGKTLALEREEGAGNAGCTRRWGALKGSKYAHQYSQRRLRNHPAFPTQWF
jgi:hypothetical protein